MEKHLHKSVNCSINSQKMPTSRWRKATKQPELVLAKYHLNLKTSQTVQKRVTRSIEIIFILVLTVGKWRTSRVPYRKASSLHSGEASLIMTKLNINYAKFLFRFWKKQLHFRMSVGFHGRIVGNSTFANSDNPLGWYSTLFQFCGNKTCSRYTQRIIDT